MRGREGRLSRRGLLSSGAGLALLAGCAGARNVVSPPASAIRGTHFEGGDLVVELRSGHDVTKVNLIGPDGSTFAERPVPKGATKVSIQMLDIKPGGSDYTHYSPGQYKLVPVSASGSKSRHLTFKPKLGIVDVEQATGVPKANGKLGVTIENSGTAPTWVYDVTYRNAPNRAANNRLVDNPGVPQLMAPDRTPDQIISPNSRQTYVGTTNPLLFTNQENQQCEGRYQFSVIVGVAIGDPLVRRINIRDGGTAHSAGLAGEYTCSDVTVEKVTAGGTDD